jgi:hypothetical protein
MEVFNKKQTQPNAGKKNAQVVKKQDHSNKPGAKTDSQEIKKIPKAEWDREFAKEYERASTLYQFKVEEARNKPNTKGIIVLGLVLLIIITYFASIGNYLASIIFFLAGFSVAFSVYDKGSSSNSYLCKIRVDGIQLNDTLYLYEHLKSFWIFYDPPYRQDLSLRSRKTLMNYVTIPLGDEDPSHIRDLLVEYIPEKEQEDPFVDVLARRIGI